MKKVAILGSTGSIGSQALEVIRKLPNKFQVVALAGGNSIELLKQQVKEFKPQYVSIKSNAAALSGVASETKVLEDGIIEIAKEVDYDIILISVTGISGLFPTIEAIKRGKRIALANKETLVTAGDIVMPMVKKYGAELIPVDSEHSAIFQCSPTGDFVKNLLITASGGPFLNKTKDEMSVATKAQTLAHPKWNMGSKITVDSATLMNKGLEVIEAHHLFQKSYENIRVVIHPQSIVHSAVEFEDGSVIAQMGVPSMHLPIQYALTYPERPEGIKSDSFNLATLGTLEFLEPDFEKFPSLKIAFEAGKKGGNAPAIMNAANEEAVYAFLNDEIKLLDISTITQKVLEEIPFAPTIELDKILEADSAARELTKQIISKMKA